MYIYVYTYMLCTSKCGKGREGGRVGNCDTEYKDEQNPTKWGSLSFFLDVGEKF